MKLPSLRVPARWRRVSRGQALVEFALILPILVLLLVMAIDFGRAFYGWVSIQNAARIGANFAGNNPKAWEHGVVDGDLQDDFVTLISDHVSGCDLDAIVDPDGKAGPNPPDVLAFDPGTEWGDHATVTLSCDFTMITPLLGSFMGNPLPMTAEAVFPVRQGVLSGPGGTGGGGGGATCTLSYVPDLINRTLDAARLKWADAGFDPALFTANPNVGTNMINNQSFTPAANVNDCVDPTGFSVFVTTVPPPPCPSGQSQVPDLIGDLVADARIEWAAAGFAAGNFKPTGADNTKTVLTQVTSPITSPVIGGCVVSSATVTITYGDPPPDPCDVPSMVGLSLTGARVAWAAAGFVPANLTHSGGPAGGNVIEQSPSHPGTVSCAVAGSVKTKN